jgi:hypothetical protein
MNLIPGQGHFGPDAIPGVRTHMPQTLVCSCARTHMLAKHDLHYDCQDARWRRGESVSLKTARDTMVPLELAQHAQMVYSAR